MGLKKILAGGVICTTLFGTGVLVGLNHAKDYNIERLNSVLKTHNVNQTMKRNYMALQRENYRLRDELNVRTGFDKLEKTGSEFYKNIKEYVTGD